MSNDTDEAPRGTLAGDWQALQDAFTQLGRGILDGLRNAWNAYRMGRWW